jgi:undecaprenyl-diphosphatase
VDIFQAIILALVQGLTEFLPVSSSAHLILVPVLLGWEDQGLAFDVAVHVGTLMAVAYYLRREIIAIVPAWLHGWSGLQWDQQGKLGWWVVLATIPVGLFGLFGGTFIENNLRSPLVIATTTLVFGLALAWADRGAESKHRVLSDLGWKDAALIGLAQAFALVPGSSRSGMTMMAALFLGLTRVDAARFSFLLSVPAIVLPGFLKGAALLAADTSVDWLVLATGVLVSAITAFLCIKAFMAFVTRVGLMPFVYYRVILAIVLFALFI